MSLTIRVANKEATNSNNPATPFTSSPSSGNAGMICQKERTPLTAIEGNTLLLFRLKSGHRKVGARLWLSRF